MEVCVGGLYYRLHIVASLEEKDTVGLYSFHGLKLGRFYCNRRGGGWGGVLAEIEYGICYYVFLQRKQVLVHRVCHVALPCFYSPLLTLALTFSPVLKSNPAKFKRCFMHCQLTTLRISSHK